MLTISQTEIQKAGGFLAALTDKSCEYIRSLLSPNAIVGFGGKDSDLERIIVHTSPHLDEYFAEIMFRSCLPQERRSCDFEEQSIFSKTNDLACLHLWPTAAVLGIGGTISGGVIPLFLFDEHVIDEEIGKSSRSAASCSQLVIEKRIRKLPPPLETLLREVNAIDEYANAHEQNLANLIKPLHEVRFTVQLDPASDKIVSDFLTPNWKRAIVDASIAAIAYCLQENIDLIGNPDEKKALLQKSLENYVENSPHKAHPDFDDALQFIRSTYGDQARFFSEAVLMKNEIINGKIVKVPILDTAGKEIPQLLLLSRVIFACDHCWGENIRNIIATHFWEVAMQSQLNFILVRRAVAEMFTQNTNVKRFVSPVGEICREILPPMFVDRGRRSPMWLVSIAPDSSVFQANKGIVNFINTDDGKAANIQPANGCGLVLIRDRIQGTTALFKCSAISNDKWERLVDLIRTREPDCWHVTRNPSGIAPFLLNGNKTHRHVPRTGLDVTALSGLVRHIFY